ncbi:MAG: hypothetical protein NTX72_05885 [Candidatus Uhrbacteria bacterium]|nr:hypothetical protein [Candidatus Uhrbacteria bacterium]
MSKVGNVQGDRQVVSELDLHNPQFERRSFVLRMRGSKEQELTMRLQVLVPHSMYLVLEDGYGLKSGQVLVRNLEMMRRLGCADAPYDKQMFVRYDNLFDACRAMSRLNPTYKAEEIPTIEAWQRDLDGLMELTWSLEVKDVQGQNEYKTRAFQAVAPHVNVVNVHKVAAREQHGRASKLEDRSGRFNPHRLPLMLLSVDVALWKRIREARGIGHRMDFRAMVLELYIHKLSEMVEVTRLDLAQKLRKNGVFGFGPNRTPRKVSEVANLLYATEKHLRTLTARPFSRVFRNVAKDLSEAASLMEDGATNRAPSKTDEAKLLYVHRAYRSLVLVQKRYLIQEVLTTVAAIHHRKEVLSDEAIQVAKDVIEAFLADTAKDEPFTNEPFEKDFRRPVLPRVREHLAKALEHLNLVRAEPLGEHTKHVRTELKSAVAPL